MVSTPKDIQVALNKLGYGPLVEDGIIGPLSKVAVKRYQSDNALSADGNPGPVTKAALTASLAFAGNKDAQTILAQDNASPPENVTAVHMPATANSPAMTVHTISDGSGSLKSVVKPLGTPTSTLSTLARTTGASPSKSAPLGVRAAAMSSTTKWSIVGGIAAAIGGLFLAKHTEKK